MTGTPETGGAGAEADAARGAAAASGVPEPRTDIPGAGLVGGPGDATAAGSSPAAGQRADRPDVPADPPTDPGGRLAGPPPESPADQAGQEPDLPPDQSSPEPDPLADLGTDQATPEPDSLADPGTDQTSQEPDLLADPGTEQATPEPGSLADADTDQASPEPDPLADPRTVQAGQEPDLPPDPGTDQASPEPDSLADPDTDQGGPGPDRPGEPPTDPAAAGAGIAPQTVVDPVPARAGEPRHIPDGHLLSNRYRLAERIATGGMGEVWRGTDELLGRPVAVKLLSAAHASDEQFRARFRAEARYAGSLSHPGIARVYDYGESAAGSGDDDQPMTGVAYLVMELVEGQALSAVLARGERMTAEATLDIVAQAAHALAAAHRAGIVHRDVKPGNLLITPDGQVKVTDFGIARAALAAHLTQSGMVIGTAQYVSPEQATARPVTAATDVYSLGVVAYECLAGRPPFTAETALALALAHVNDRPPQLPDDVPPQVAALVGQMMAKDPAGRPASAQVVADRATALKDTSLSGEGAWATGSAELADPAAWYRDPGPASPAVRAAGTAPMARAGARRPRSRRSAALVLTTGVVAAVVAGVIAVLVVSRHPATASTSPPVTSSPVHRSARPSPTIYRQPGIVDQTTPRPQRALPPPPRTRHAPTPTKSATPSSTPSSPASSSPPPTTTSPSPTGTPTPTPSGTASPGETTQPAAQQGVLAANTMTQDG